MIKLGDFLTTDFYPRDRKLHRKVIAIDEGQSCETGRMVTTVDTQGRKLRCDQNWYKPI